eukprot:UC1_evm1s1130
MVMGLFVDGYYYPGVVARVQKSGYRIRFDDGDVCTVKSVVPHQYIQTGTNVLARMCESREYRAGVIESVIIPAKRYRIRLWTDDGEKEGSGEEADLLVDVDKANVCIAPEMKGKHKDGGKENGNEENGEE